MPASDFDQLRAAIGEQISDQDVVTASQVGRFAATLDLANPVTRKGDPLPHGWHGIFFPPLAPLSVLGEDGMPTGAGHGPNLPIPNSRVTTRRSQYLMPLQVGDEITKVTEIAQVAVDETATEPAATITIRETIETPRGTAVIDELDRDIGPGAGSGAGPQLPESTEAPAWTETYPPDPIMMFRLSAVRYNGHRIHYDRDYSTEVEGLPGLVVPHTLISALMLKMCQRQAPDRELAGFDYRVDKRIFDTGPFTIFGQPSTSRAALWAVDHEGTTGTVAEARFAD